MSGPRPTSSASNPRDANVLTSGNIHMHNTGKMATVVTAAQRDKRRADRPFYDAGEWDCGDVEEQHI